MQIENRTPHAVALTKGDGSRVILVPIKPAVRLTIRAGDVEEDLVCGVTVHRPATFHGITGLPEPRDGVLLLVSQLAAVAIAELHPARTDIVHPNSLATRGIRRDRAGIISVSAVIRAA